MATARRISISNHSNSPRSTSRTDTPSTPPSSPKSVPSTPSSSIATEESPLQSVTSALQLTKNVIAALDTYTAKMQSDLDDGRIPAIASYEIRNAQRYQVILRMKVERMETIKVRLESRAKEDQTIDWDHEYWQQDLDYVDRARKYLIGAHVFYKINYELAKL